MCAGIHLGSVTPWDLGAQGTNTNQHEALATMSLTQAFHVFCQYPMKCEQANLLACEQGESSDSGQFLVVFTDRATVF